VPSPLERVNTAASVRVHAELDYRHALSAAREAGHTFEEIAEAAGVTRSAVYPQPEGAHQMTTALHQRAQAFKDLGDNLTAFVREWREELDPTEYEAIIDLQGLILDRLQSDDQ
jgi:HPt (histidine-containing phosphotransfer) domain-containing protein